MSAAAIRAFGVFTFVVEAMILFVMVGPRARLLGPLPNAAIVSAIVVFVAATSVGAGLLFLRKWAAVLFSLALVGLPIYMAIDSIGDAPATAFLILIAAMVVLAMPVIIIVRSWSVLSWRGKWFL